MYSSERTTHAGLYLRSVVVGFGIVLLSGCTTRVESGAEVTIQYATWVPIVIVVVALVAVPITWFLRKKLGLGGWVYPLMLLWPLLALAAAPSYHNSYATITDEEFHNRCGLWGETRDTDMRFSDIKSIEVSTFRQGAGKNRSKNDSATIQLKNGQVEYFNAAWSTEEDALEEFILRAKKLGIRVTDVRN